MSRPVRSLMPAAEAALVGLSLAVVVGFARLFIDGSFFPRLAAFVIVAHGAAIITRRAGWSVGASAAVSIVALGVTVGLTLYPSTTFLGLPTGETLSTARTDLSDIWSQFQSVQAPTPVTTPFLLAAGLALWWSAFVADWAAFRVWVPFESVVPAGTVFVFSSLFAAHRSQVALSGLFLLAALAFLLLHRVTRQQANAGWVSADVQRGTNALLRAARCSPILAVAASMIVGPNLPQAHSAAVFAWRGGGSGPSARTTVSPLVNIEHRLVDQSNQELFTVRSERRSYWRLTALDQFDGQIWKSDGSYESADGRLPRSVDSSAATAVFQQTYLITSLDTIWLPAAYVPRSLDKASTDVRFEPDTSTLIVGTNVANSNNASYTVQSALPLYEPQQLEQAPRDVPKNILDKELQLPPDFSQNVVAEAQRVVAGASTTYDKALALQDYFRNNFEYDLTVPPGHSTSAIENFLFVEKRGYCEQFAGTYAAMARAVGIPARVAVGFTPGDEDPTNPGLYHVKGLHAHAWPEVYIAGRAGSCSSRRPAAAHRTPSSTRTSPNHRRPPTARPPPSSPHHRPRPLRPIPRSEPRRRSRSQRSTRERSATRPPNRRSGRRSASAARRSSRSAFSLCWRCSTSWRCSRSSRSTGNDDAGRRSRPTTGSASRGRRASRRSACSASRRDERRPLRSSAREQAARPRSMASPSWPAWSFARTTRPRAPATTKRNGRSP